MGDNGNVTITESSGNSRYEVEKISGFPIASGLEDCCLRFVPDFINDAGGQRAFMAKPCFVVYHGRINSYASVTQLMEKVGRAFIDPGETEFKYSNIVIVATGFSDDAITGLALNFKDPQTIKAFPLVAPMTAEPGSQLQFLMDVAALTGATILDQTSVPLEQANLLHLGRGIEAFEAHRWRSNIIVGEPTELDDEGAVKFRTEREDRVLNRSVEVEQQLRGAPSEYTSNLIKERLAKLTGGIARLKVIGASNGELKEKRDRAEDAVCAVRGAIKHGCLPGGCWVLLRVVEELMKLNDTFVTAILIPALEAPFWKLLQNSGIADVEERNTIRGPITIGMRTPVEVDNIDEATGENVKVKIFKPMVYDCLEGKHVDAIEGGILDSTPAVLEAVRNALSIASLLGTLGGTVVFQRDAAMENYEARQNSDYLREDGDLSNPANERG